MALAFIHNRRPGAAVVSPDNRIHNYIPVVTAPTCTEQGYTTYTCQECGKSYVDNYLPALGHSFKLMANTDGHWQLCSRCGETSEVVPHTPGAPATEERAQTCTVCGYVITPAIQHIHDFPKQLHSDASGHWQVCSKCGEKSMVIPHTPGAAATEERAQLCTVCGYVITPALQHTHNYTTYHTPPTCTEQGYTTQACSCGESKTEYLPALGHDKKYTVTKAATCTEEGDRYWWCTRCDWSEHEVIPKIGHTEETVNAIPASCNKVGYTEGCKCSVCQSFITAPIELPALGHNWTVIPAIEPTCTTEGRGEMQACSRCGEIEGDMEDYPALGHDYEWVSDETAHWKSCSRCVSITDYGLHSDTAIGSLAREAQCLSNALYYKKCPTCGYEHKDKYYEEVGTATGHNDKMTFEYYNESQHKVYKKCTNCNEITTDIKYQNHDWEELVTGDYKQCKWCGALAEI